MHPQVLIIGQLANGTLRPVKVNSDGSLIASGGGSGGGGAGTSDATAFNQQEQIDRLIEIRDQLILVAGQTDTFESLIAALNGFNDQLEGYTDEIETNQTNEIARLIEIRDRLPSTVGIKTAALSFPVTLSSDGTFTTNIGLTSNTAATTDTGTFSLISLLKRLLSAKLPTTLVNDRFKVDGSGVTQPISGSVNVSNFPVTQPISGSVDVGNFPATQPISGSVNVSNFPATQPISGSLEISNLPETQPISGSVDIGNFPETQPISGSVSIGNFPATQPISAISLPLPTGAANDTNQASEVARLIEIRDLIAGNAGAVGENVTITNFPATQPISASALPLPTGAANDTNQASEIERLIEVRDRLPATTGAKTAANSLPVTLSTDGAFTNSFGASADTAATTDTGTFSLLSIFKRLLSVKLPSALVNDRFKVDGSGVTQPISGGVSVDNFPATQPISASALPLPTGAASDTNQATEITRLTEVRDRLPSTVGAKTAANSFPVTLSTDGTFTTNLGITSNTAATTDTGAFSLISLLKRLLSVKLPTSLVDDRFKVDGSGVTQPISGSVSVGNFPATQPISASALPLPTGAASDTNQATEITRLTEVRDRLPSTVGAKTAANSFPVTLSTDGAFTNSFGASADTAATTDTGTFSLLSIFKRLLSVKLPSALVNDRFKVDGSGVTQPISGSVTVSNLSPTITTFTASSAATSSTSATVLAANANRLGATIVNNSNVDIFLRRGATAILGQGILLKAAGGTFEINSTNLYKGLITGVSESSGTLAVEEGV